MSVILTVCDTCKRDGWDPKQHQNTDGERLADLIEAEIVDVTEITLRTHSCLMGCEFSCNIALQSDGKLTYALGTFEPTEAAAQGIVEFARKYNESETGQVPYRTWPEAIKGHFRSRIPPAPTQN